MRTWNSEVASVVLAVLGSLSPRSATSAEEGPYRGKYLGKLNSYHHQVAGDVYAVDDYTLLLTQFSYDGNGADTFFWAGSSNRPGPQGFIVADEHGKTNVLERYLNKDLTVSLPDKKKITEIKWFAIYDLSSQNTFGDIYVPEEFEPPALQKISALSSKCRGVKSDSVEVVDSKSIRLPDFSFDGSGKAHFRVGVGPQPASKGFTVPDEYGYLDKLRAYNKESIVLQLPGDLTIFDIDWFSVYDLETKENCGSVIVPDGLNVPPSLIEIIHHRNSLPNCEQLHRKLRVSWEIFGPQITIQIAGQVAENDYMAFGLSGSPDKSRMLNADVTVAYIDSYRGYATDYNISSFSPCARVLGQYKGVCRDELVGGMDNNQLHTFSREDGINVVTYRRSLISPDPGDKPYPTESPAYVVWALGPLDHNKEPSFHNYYMKSDLKLELNRKEPENNCFAFTRSQEMYREPWEKSEIFDRSIRTFRATIGPSGGRRGYQGITGMTTSGLAWYINGRLIPELWMRRGLTYSFKVHGGNNPHSAETYHPMIITTEPHGGLEQLSEAAQKQIRILAGVEYTRRGQPRPTAAGPLCLLRRDRRDQRLDDDFESFKKFNRSLVETCEKGDGAVLEVTPNASWPDVVYYNSFTHINMGWKIHVVDNYNLRSGASSPRALFGSLSVAAFFLLHLSPAFR